MLRIWDPYKQLVKLVFDRTKTCESVEYLIMPKPKIRGFPIIEPETQNPFFRCC